MYHELAHVSHYQIAGECYWRKVRAHEVFMALATLQDPTQESDPYGDPTNLPSPASLYVNFPIVALTESWGEHVGVLYTARKYPTAAVPGFQTTTWQLFLERRLTIKNNFIPEGLHWDLMDGIDPSDSITPNGLTINDNVSGATLIELYNLLDNNISDYKTEVISSTSASGDILPLFSQYGY